MSGPVVLRHAGLYLKGSEAEGMYWEGGADGEVMGFPSVQAACDFLERMRAAGRLRCSPVEAGPC